MFAACGQHPVRFQFEIKVFFPQETIHKMNHLQHQLILSQIISIFEYDCILLFCSSQQRKLSRTKGTLKTDGYGYYSTGAITAIMLSVSRTSKVMLLT